MQFHTWQLHQVWIGSRPGYSWIKVVYLTLTYNDVVTLRPKIDGSEQGLWSPRTHRFIVVWNHMIINSVTAHLSVVCLSSVTFVRPIQGLKLLAIFLRYFCTLAILWPPWEILRRSSQETPSVGSVNHARGTYIAIAFGYLCGSWASCWRKLKHLQSSSHQTVVLNVTGKHCNVQWPLYNCCMKAVEQWPRPLLNGRLPDMAKWGCERNPSCRPGIGGESRLPDSSRHWWW